MSRGQKKRPVLSSPEHTPPSSELIDEPFDPPSNDELLTAAGHHLPVEPQASVGAPVRERLADLVAPPHPHLLARTEVERLGLR